MVLTKKYLYENYICQNKTEKQIAKELNIGVGKVDYWVRKFELNFKKTNPDKVFNYTHIDRFDPIFCYYAGLVATDGYLNYQHRYIALRVGNFGCETVLDNLRNYFNYPKPLSVYTTSSIKFQYELRLPNKCIFDELGLMGIFGKKECRTFDLDWFNMTTDECRKMFLRGVMDGDGNIHHGAFRIVMKSANFIQHLLVVLNTYITQDTYIVKTQSNSTGQLYTALCLYKADSLRFYSFIYEGFNDYRFSDKYNKYLSIS